MKSYKEIKQALENHKANAKRETGTQQLCSEIAMITLQWVLDEKITK